MHAIQAHLIEGAAPAYVLVKLDTGDAQLMVTGASEMTEDVWDEAIQFCYAAGWAPRHDDPDIYIGFTDTEIYLLVEIEGEDG